MVSQDTTYWQNFYNGAGKRHAHLYYEKARQGCYDFDPQELATLTIKRMEAGSNDNPLETANLLKAGHFFRVNGQTEQAQELMRFDLKQISLMGEVQRIFTEKIENHAKNTHVLRQKADEVYQDFNRVAEENTQLGEQMYARLGRIETDLDKHLDEMDNLLIDSIKIVHGEAGVTEDVDKRRKGWTKHDKEWFFELRNLLYDIKNPLELSFRSGTPQTRLSPPKDKWVQPPSIELSQEQRGEGRTPNKLKRVLSLAWKGVQREPISNTSTEIDLSVSILEALKKSNKVGLYGSLGVGKTTLINQLWEQPDIDNLFPDGKFWIREPRVRDEEIVYSLSAILSEPEIQFKSLQQRQEAVKQWLTGKKALIYLDEVDSQDELIGTMSCLPSSCTLLVSASHTRPLQVLEGELLFMEPFKPNKAVALFRAWLDTKNYKYDLQVEQEICQLLAYRSLAIELVSRCIAEFHPPFEEVLGQLRQIRKKYSNNKNAPLCIALTFCISQLSDEAKGILSIFCKLPVIRVNLDVIEAIGDGDVANSLYVLLDMGLIRSDNLGYFILPCLPKLVDDIDSLPMSKINGDSLNEKLLSFLQTYLHENAKDFGRLKKFPELIFWMIEYYIEQRNVVKALDSLRLSLPYLMENRYWDKLEKYLKFSIQSGSHLSGQDQTSLEYFRYQLALLYYHARQDDQALDMLQKNLQLLRFPNDSTMISLTHYTLGNLHERNEAVNSACQSYYQAIDTSKQENHPVHIHAAFRLGELKLKENDVPTAKEAFQIAHKAIQQYSLPA